MGERSRAKWSPEPQAPRSQPSSNNETIMSTLNYSWNVRGTLNGDFMSASGTTASIDGVADVHGTAGEGAPFNHSTWIWGGMAHYGLAWMKDGHKVNPCEKYPYHMTRHWYGEDGSHIWSSHTITGAEGAWAGDIACIAEHFVPKGPILGGYIRGQYPSHWVASKRSDREVDVHGIVTLMVKGGGTYTAHVHEYIKFWEPCVTINRPYWNFGKPPAEKMGFSWHLFGTLGNKQIAADGYGYGGGYRQHHWGKGGKGWGEHGLPNLNWALAWEGHAGMHFFTRFPKGVTNPFHLALPEGFTIERKWWGQDGAHWATTHDVKFDGAGFNKEIVLVGDGFKTGSLMLWDGNKEKGNWIVKAWPQYVLAVPKGNDHIWYRSTFQFELNNGAYYTGYWEMDIHFRKALEPGQMPNPYVVKFWPETWDSKPFYWHFYEREEVEQSTYDKVAA